MLRRNKGARSGRRTVNRVFWGISSFQMLAMFRRGLFYNFLSIYLRHFLGLSVTETTLFATLPMLFNVVFQMFVWGPVSDRRQIRRTLIIYGELLASAGTVGVWYAHRLAGQPGAAGYAIIIGLTVVEIFWSMSNIGWSALISDIYLEKDRSAVQARLASVGGLGRVVGVFCGGYLYDGLGLRYQGWGFFEGPLFFIASGVMLLSVIPLLWVPEGGVLRGKTLEGRPPETPQSGDDAVFWIFLLAMVFINFGRNSIAVVQTQYLVLESGFGVSSQGLSYIVNTQSLAMILTGLVAANMGKRMGEGRALLLGTVAGVAALLVLAAAERIGWIYFSNFMRGFSEVVILSTAYAFASVLIPPRKRAGRFGWFNATFFLSWGLAGTFIAGPVVDLLIAAGFGEVFSYRMSFLAAALITLTGLILLTLLLWVYIPRRSGRVLR